MTKQQELKDIFDEAIDECDWDTARKTLAKVIKSDWGKMAIEMNRIYHNTVCKDCSGTGKVVEGEFDNQEIIDCVCQIK